MITYQSAHYKVCLISHCIKALSNDEILMLKIMWENDKMALEFFPGYW